MKNLSYAILVEYNQFFIIFDYDEVKNELLNCDVEIETNIINNSFKNSINTTSNNLNSLNNIEQLKFSFFSGVEPNIKNEIIVNKKEDREIFNLIEKTMTFVKTNKSSEQTHNFELIVLVVTEDKDLKSGEDTTEMVYQTKVFTEIK